MSTTDDDKNVFRFFDLPPELRDIIYYAALITINRRLPCNSAIYKATSIASTNLLLVSQRFLEEYRTFVRKNVAVQLFISCQGCLRDADFEPPFLLCGMAEMTVILDMRVDLQPCPVDEVEQNLEHCTMWLPRFLRNVLEKAHVTLIIGYPSHDNAFRPDVLKAILAFCKELPREGMQTFLHSVSKQRSWSAERSERSTPGPSLSEYGTPVMKLSTGKIDSELLPSAADKPISDVHGDPAA